MANDQIVRFRPAHESEYCFTQGRWSNDFLFLGGMTAIDEHGVVLHRGNLAAQMRSIYRDIARLLAQYDLTLGDIVRETVFTSDIAAWRETLPLRREIFGGVVPPPGSIVGVAELAAPDMLIEIEITARRRSWRARLVKSFADALTARNAHYPQGSVSGRI